MTPVGNDGEVTTFGTFVVSIARINASTENTFLDFVETEVLDLGLSEEIFVLYSPKM